MFIKLMKKYHLKKRILDIIISVTIIVVLSPLIIILCLFILLENGLPIIFIQARPGLNEKPFMLYKIRSMTNRKNIDGDMLPDKLRMTRFGLVLRKISLDELPELFNVVKGDMSLVGPRPLFMKYLPYYTKRERIRHSVRPGITGLAQVCGRNLLGWDERLDKDVEYVEKMSFYLDMKIILKTIFQVLSQKGIALNIIEDLDVYRNKLNMNTVNENTSC